MNASSTEPAAAGPPPSAVVLDPSTLTLTLEDAMLVKATAPWGRMVLLTLTGGGFIALGFVFMVTTQQGMGEWPVGIAKLIGGVVFSVGLGLVVISGSDLFTGTTLTVMPRLSGRISTARMLGHWAVSAGGNLVGSVLVALLILGAGTHATNGSAWGLVVLETTQSKLGHDWHQAFFLGVLANFAVCLAVWVAAAGFEHSVANMFMLPMGLLITNFAGDAFWQGEAIRAAGVSPADFSSITVGAAVWDNLVPVLLGNIVGGAVLVGAYFWATYRPTGSAATARERTRRTGACGCRGPRRS